MKKVILTLIVGLACMTSAKAGDWSISIGIPGLFHVGNHHHHVVSHCAPTVVYHQPAVVYNPPPVVYHQPTVVYSPPVYHYHSTGAVTYTVTNQSGSKVRVRAPHHVKDTVVHQERQRRPRKKD